MKKQILISLTIFLIMIIIIILIAILMAVQLKDNIAYIQCCGGNVCTDTYYTSEDNKCHLVLCENNLFTNKSNCVYEGENITMIFK